MVGPFRDRVALTFEPGRSEQLADVVDVAVLGVLAGVAVVGHQQTFTNRTLDVMIREKQHDPVRVKRLALNQKRPNIRKEKRN